MTISDTDVVGCFYRNKTKRNETKQNATTTLRQRNLPALNYNKRNIELVLEILVASQASKKVKSV